MFNDCSNFYGTTSTSQSMFVCLTLNWCDSIFSCCCLFFFFSHSLYFLLASFSPDKKSATLVELAQQLQWYFLQWNSVTVCLQPHVKHEWNNRYSRFFCVFSHSVCVGFFPFWWRRLCILFDFPLIFYSCLHWCHLHFGERFIQHLLLVSIIIWSETRPFLSNCVFVEKEREWGKKIRLFKRPIYILKMFATTLNNSL